MEKSDIIFQLNHITQEFPGVKALDDVSFSVRRGRIHALVGENGAGKSTLIKVLAGINTHFQGEVFLMVSYFIRRIRMNPSRWESVLFTRN